MDLPKIFSGPVSDADLHDLFTRDLDENEFAECLAAALTKGGSPELTITGVRRVFHYGVSLVERIDLAASTSEEVDYQGLVPEEDLTLQSVTGSHSPSPANDGDDITSFSHTTEEPDTTAGEQKQQIGIHDSQDLSETLPKKADATDNAHDSIVNNSRVSLATSASQNSKHEIQIGTMVKVKPNANIKVTTDGIPDGDYDLVYRVCRILKLWFLGVRNASEKLGTDFSARLFGLPGVENTLSQHELYKILSVSKLIVEKATSEYSKSFIEALKEIILLMYEALSTIFQAMATESSNQTSNKFIVMKGLVFTFFQVDLSECLSVLLEITSPAKSREILSDSSNSFDLRLSYDTLMRLCTIYYSLANCPLNLLLADKMSLSLDITSLSEISANHYSNIIVAKDYNLPETQYHLTSRLLPLLTANFNYFYQLHPDLLSNQLDYLKVFSWLTGKTSVLYMSIDNIGSVSEYPEHSKIEDKYDPFLYETEKFEYAQKIAKVGHSKDREYAVSSPTYLLIQLVIYQLARNQSFVTFLTQKKDSKTPLLDVWLSVSSYIHHYQYKSRVNVFGSRVSLLILLKLTSNESDTLLALRDYEINEDVWKLCRHRSSPIPRTVDAEKKSALMYIVDIVQIDLRFNLNKKLDFDNCKAALCVLYQILLFAERNPFEGLRSYCWAELFKTLINFIKFVHKHYNEEDTKYIVEEVFSIFEIVLGPALGELVELSSDNWIFGKHIVKAVNFELYYAILENYDTLLSIFDKFIIKRDNFDRVSICFAKLGETFDMTIVHTSDVSEIKESLTALLLATQQNSDLTHADLGKFNHADTFKFLDKRQGYVDFQKQSELIEIFGLLYSNNWSR